MARYFLEVMYDGNALHGSQLQGDLPTVQLAVNNALTTLLRTPIESFGASRTDEGVHALCNMYHFDYEEPLHPQFKYRINAILPEMVALKQVYVANNPELNARFDAVSRKYRYKIYAKKNPFLQYRALYFPFHINLQALHATAAVLKEYTNFETFSKRNTQTKTFNCKIIEAYWEEHGAELHFVIKANRFLRGMVRGIVGTQLQIARGKGDLADFRAIIESKDCSKADFSVTGNGLYLEEIAYPEGALTPIYDEQQY
jgi:tRNA pseudouridine38-40 synthase